MKFVKEVAAVAVILLLTGCATGLNSMQQREYAAFKNGGVLIEEKKPETGVILGILPGGGSFYAREPALGIINLLLWPASVLWDPISGSNGSKTINYDITKHHLKKEKEKEMLGLDEKLALGEIENKAYVFAKRKIEQKYSFD